MRMTYVSKIQAKLKRFQTIRARKNTTQVLDGSYKSIFKGRSMNFDELREYVQGDDVKDIDWKASARSQKTLVRQYIAERKHNIMLVFDTNKNMLGHSDGLEEKRELAIMSAGTLAYFVNKNGDYVSAIYNTPEGLKYFPFRTGLGNLELILDNYHNAVTMKNTTSINDTIEYIIRNFSKKMIVILVSDVRGFRSITEANLKRLLVAHDVLAMNISDAAVHGKNSYDLNNEIMMPAFLSKNKKLTSSIKSSKEVVSKEVADKLKKFGVSCSTFDNVDELEKEILDLLAKHSADKSLK